MKYYSADWLFTGTGSPLSGGCVAIEEDGQIAGVYASEADKPDDGAEVIRLKGVLTPGFINTHCHLELSHLKGKIPEGGGLPDFLNHVYSLRDVDPETKEAAQKEAEEEMINSGIVAVGDISNGSDTFALKAKSAIEYHTFIEVFSWDPQRAVATYQRGCDLKDEYDRAFASSNKPALSSLNPHAPYTVSEKLFQELNRGEYCDGMPMTMHHQETPGENELFETATGPMAEFLSRLRGRNDTFRAHDANSNQFTIPLLPKCQNMLLVHNTMSTRADLERAQAYSSRFFYATCPRANWYIERRLPDYDLWREMDLRICIGTDSLSSNWDLNFWNELTFLNDHYPGLPFEELLQWATYNGAEALEMKHLGRIEKGATPGLLHLETDGAFELNAVTALNRLD